MNEIRDAGSMNFAGSKMPINQIPKTEQETPHVLPSDQVTISNPEKSLAKKIIEFPGKVIEGTAGAVVAAVTTPLHIIPGAIKGLSEGLTEKKGYGYERPFHLAMFAQNIIAGAAGGFMLGGPLGAMLGGGGALLFTGLTTWFGHRSEAYPKMIEHLEAKVNKAVEDNKGTKTEVAFQNATEGAIIGGAIGAKAGWHLGFESGKGMVSGVVGVAEGIAEGIYEVGKNIITRKTLINQLTDKK